MCWDDERCESWDEQTDELANGQLNKHNFKYIHCHLHGHTHTRAHIYTQIIGHWERSLGRLVRSVGRSVVWSVGVGHIQCVAHTSSYEYVWTLSMTAPITSSVRCFPLKCICDTRLERTYRDFHKIPSGLIISVESVDSAILDCIQQWKVHVLKRARFRCWELFRNESFYRKRHDYCWVVVLWLEPLESFCWARKRKVVYPFIVRLTCQVAGACSAVHLHRDLINSR